MFYYCQVKVKTRDASILSYRCIGIGDIVFRYIGIVSAISLLHQTLWISRIAHLRAQFDWQQYHYPKFNRSLKMKYDFVIIYSFTKSPTFSEVSFDGRGEKEIHSFAWPRPICTQFVLSSGHSMIVRNILIPIKIYFVNREQSVLLSLTFNFHFGFVVIE